MYYKKTLVALTIILGLLITISTAKAKADIYYGDWNKDIKSFNITCKADRYQSANGEWKIIDAEFVEQFKTIISINSNLDIDPRDPRLNVYRHINRSNGIDSINGMTRPAKYSIVRVIDNHDTRAKNIMIMYILDYKSMEDLTANVLTIDPKTGKGKTIYGWHNSNTEGDWRDELSSCVRSK